MSSSAIVSATVDPEILEEATAIFAEIGLTVADAMRLLLKKTVADQAFPFDPILPNQETMDAMLAARRGEVEPVTLDELQAVLDAGDWANLSV